MQRKNSPYETFLEGVELCKNKIYESQTGEVTAEKFLQ